jgi:predicted permease
MIAVCIIGGMVLRRFNIIPYGAHKGINTWILYFAMPAVSFKYIPKIEWSAQLLFPILSSFLVWLGSWLFIHWYCHHKGYKQRSVSSLEIAAGFSNTSFIGFPLVAAYYGEKFLSIAIICDQTMFMLLSSIGVIAALKVNSDTKIKLNFAAIFIKLIKFPPFIACIVALCLSPFIPFHYAEAFFDKLAATVGPLALFSIGLQLKFDGWRQQFSQISVAMFYKLVLAPIVVLIFALLLGIRGDIARISIFEAAMPTVVTSSIIAEQYHLNTKLVNLIIGFTIVVGLFTTALWDLVLNQVFI